MPWLSDGKGGEFYTGSVNDSPNPGTGCAGCGAFAGGVTAFSVLIVLLFFFQSCGKIQADIAAERAINPPFEIAEHPIANLKCGSEHILVTQLISGPGAAEEVRAALTEEADSHYLRAGQSCERAFRNLVDRGTYHTYVIYIGPFSLVEALDACSERSTTSYVLRLGPAADNGEPCVP